MSDGRVPKRLASRRYPAYRDPGVEWMGEIPAHWEVRRNKQLFNEIDDRSESGRETLLSVSEYFGVKPRRDVVDEGELLTRAESLVGYKLCRQGDLAMNFMLAWKKGLGFSDYQGIVSPSYAVFRPTESQHYRYFHYLLRSMHAVSEFERYSYGIIDSRLRLYPDTFGSLRSPVPPLAEQQAIADFLDRETDKIDALVVKQRELRDRLQEKRTALISHAVTKGLNADAPIRHSGVEWLGEVPAHWVVAALRHRYDQTLGKMLDTKRITGDHLVPYLRNVDVRWDHINTFDLPSMDIRPHEIERFTVRSGDLLVCEGGEAGRCAIWRGGLDPCGYQKALHRLRPIDHRRERPRFLYYAIAAAVEREAFADGQGSTIAHLTGDMLRAHRFPFPPASEQQAIADHLDRETAKIDALTAKITESIDLLNEYRTALISAAVTGKIDVRDHRAVATSQSSSSDEAPA